MFPLEAKWLAKRFGEFDSNRLSPLIHIGSSGGAFREVTQPWIHTEIERPLLDRGVTLVNFDQKYQAGVDIVGDIFDDDAMQRLSDLQAKAVLCANILEHVVSPGDFARRCLRIVPVGGLLFVTVPRSYPHHGDPIDTMFRPSPAEIAALFPSTKVLASEIIEPGSYRDDIRKRPWIVFRFIRLLFPFLSLHRWKRTASKLHWVVRPYQVSCVVLEKTGAA